MVKEKYIYAGIKVYDEQTNYIFIKIIDDMKDPETFLNNRNYLSFSKYRNYFIGQIIELEQYKDNENSYSFEELKKDYDYKIINPEFVEKLMFNNILEEKKEKFYRNKKRLGKERKNLDKMTLGEIKEKMKNNWQFKELIRAYIMDR